MQYRTRIQAPPKLVFHDEPAWSKSRRPKWSTVTVHCINGTTYQYKLDGEKLDAYPSYENVMKWLQQAASIKGEPSESLFVPETLTGTTTKVNSKLYGVGTIYCDTWSVTEAAFDFPLNPSYMRTHGDRKASGPIVEIKYFLDSPPNKNNINKK